MYDFAADYCGSAWASNAGPLPCYEATVNKNTGVETNDGHFHKIDIDLKGLASKSVAFIFTVYNNGANTDDWAFWMLPGLWQ